MKKISMTFILAIALFTVVNTNVMAQNRICDVALKISSPINGEQVAHGDTAAFCLRIINHGPDAILPIDTFYFYYLSPVFGWTSDYITFSDTLNADDSATTAPYMYWVNDDNDSSNQDVTVCAYLTDSISHFTDTNKENDTADCVHFVLEGIGQTGIVSSEKDINFSVYPNPANFSVWIAINLPLQKKLKVIVTDIRGRVVFSKDYGALQGILRLPVNTAKLAPGSYFLKLCVGRQATTKSLIIQ